MRKTEAHLNEILLSMIPPDMNPGIFDYRSRDLNPQSSHSLKNLLDLTDLYTDVYFIFSERNCSMTKIWLMTSQCYSLTERFSFAKHSVLAWRIPGMGEPGGLPSVELHRVRHDWSDLAAAAGTSVDHYSYKCIQANIWCQEVNVLRMKTSVLIVLACSLSLFVPEHLLPG